MASVNGDPRGERREIEGDLAVIAERLKAITVQVHSRGAATGSGVIWDRSGIIVTNAHVVRGSATVVLSTGRRLDARLLARDLEADLAALAIDAGDLPAAEIGDADVLRSGDLVIAVGHPLGLVGALTAGIVHAGRGGIARSRWITADLRLAPGNSGGPLADARGRVVGINAMIAGGLALAVPSHVVARFLAPLGDRARVP